jgi:hypothetical protein
LTIKEPDIAVTGALAHGVRYFQKLVREALAAA